MTLPLVKRPRKHRTEGVDILYEDRDLIVVNKASGVLTIATHLNEPFTAENVLNDYVRKGCARSNKRVFVVHRLDRETSGILIFAKSEEAQTRLKDAWRNNEKLYLTAVLGHLKEKRGIFASYLAENEDLFVRSTADPLRGKFSQTVYAVIKELPLLSLVKIRLLTGRRNQIRVHFSEHGHPVIGDSRYGGAQPPFHERLCLHAKSIAFDHPHSGRRLFFDTPIPELFKRLGQGFDEPNWAATSVPDPEPQPDDPPEEGCLPHENKPTPRPAAFPSRPALRR